MGQSAGRTVQYIGIHVARVDRRWNLRLYRRRPWPMTMQQIAFHPKHEWDAVRLGRDGLNTAEVDLASRGQSEATE